MEKQEGFEGCSVVETCTGGRGQRAPEQALRSHVLTHLIFTRTLLCIVTLTSEATGA